jgi:hypothetical protein
MQIKKLGALAFAGLAVFGGLTACSEDEQLNDELVKVLEEKDGLAREDAECVADYMTENKEGDAQELADQINAGEAGELTAEALEDCGLLGGEESEDEVVVDEGTTGEDAGDVVEDEEMTEEEAE